MIHSLKPHIGLQPVWDNNPLNIPAPKGAWIKNEGDGETVIDLSNNWVGATVTFSTPDWVDGGLSFVSGNSDYIKINQATVPITTYPITLVTLFKTGASGTARPLNYGDDSVDDDEYFGLDANVDGGGTDFSYWFRSNDSSSIVHTGITPTVNTKYMMAGISHSSALHDLYINGNWVENSTTDMGAWPSNIDSVGIGALIRGGAGNIYSDCTVYLSLLFDVALSATQVWFLYTNPYYAWDYLDDTLIAILAAQVAAVALSIGPFQPTPFQQSPLEVGPFR